MRVHALLSGSRANGPGLRSVCWFQFCPLHCVGCINPETWDWDGGYEEDVPHLAAQIVRESAEGTEGVTFSGGEPLAQPDALYSLIRDIRNMRPSLSFGLFTGYARAELCKIPAWTAIRATLDFAVMGRYDRSQPCNKPLVSSANQELVLLSNRYQLSDFPAQSEEVFIGPDGLCQITGFAR